MLLLVLPLLFTFAFAAYLFLHHHYTYWKHHGVPQLNPSFAFGDLGPVVRKKITLVEFYQNVYQRTKQCHPLLGLYILFRPALLVNDPILARDIMGRDAQHFQHRGVYVDEKRDPLNAHLFAIGGEKWYQMHQKVAPAFTPLKLKEIFHTQQISAVKLREHLRGFADSGRTVDVVPLVVRYFIDMSASVVCGAEIDSINNSEEPFYKIVHSSVESNVKNMLRWTGSLLIPSLIKLTRTRLFQRHVEEFLTYVIHQTVEFREKNNISCRDTLQYMLKLKEAGSMTIPEMVCMAYTFLLGGMDTSVSSTTFCLYEIAKSSEIQQRLQNEIDETLQRNDGQFTYDTVAGMAYLDNCVNEIFRKFPTIAYLHRVCTKEYITPDTNTIIRNGTLVLIPLHAMHRDPDFFPDPDDYLPDRFNDLQDIHRSPYFPFGEGLRQCLGQRLGKMNIKITLVYLLASYDFQLANPDDRSREVQIDPEHFTIFPKGRIDMKITHRKCSSPSSRHSMSLPNK